MMIELKPEHQSTIDLAIRSGACQDPAEALDQAFEILREQLDCEDWLKDQREAIAAKIATGFAQSERGEMMDGDEALEMLRRRRAERPPAVG
ncbi:MAG: type II toxin-antitoxin system ParD family antitoxin [Bryobacteraceae bacterium]|jgi:predicted transcriptional regulator